MKNNDLTDLVNLQLSNQMQQANIAAQQEIKQAEISKVRNKYIDDSLFDGFRNELDNYKIQLGHNINKALKSKEGFTENLVTQVWDKGIGQYNKIVNDIDNLRNNIDVTKEQILSCTTLSVADKTYDGIKDVVRIFKSRWINEEKQLIHDWTNNLLELIQQEEVNNPIQPNIPPVNNLNQLEKALKRIEELEQSLFQARHTIEKKDTLIDGMRDNLAVKDNKIFEQADKIEVQSNKIVELQGKLLDKTEQITVEVNKYNTEHNKLIDTKHKLDTHKLKLTTFIDTHQEIEGQDQLVEMLGDLNINNDM